MKKLYKLSHPTYPSHGIILDYGSDRPYIIKVKDRRDCICAKRFSKVIWKPCHDMIVMEIVSYVMEIVSYLEYEHS